MTDKRPLRYMKTRRLTIKLQALVRGWLGRRRTLSLRIYSQRLGEERFLSSIGWNQLVRRREEEELILGARSEDVNDNKELHQVIVQRIPGFMFCP